MYRQLTQIIDAPSDRALVELLCDELDAVRAITTGVGW